MVEKKLNMGSLSKKDNVINVEMTEDEISFIKYFINKFNPKKIVEIGVSAGGNTVNLLNWKDKEAQLFSVDIATKWYKNESKLSGFMAEELNVKDNWKIFRGYDYLDIYEEIGNDIDFIVIDTTHVLPGEILTFLAALPQLKDGCIVVLHDIHLNMLSFSKDIFEKYNIGAFCTGLLFGAVSSNQKWTLNSSISNIGAFVVDEDTRDNIRDIFHILCTTWFEFPYNLNLTKYNRFIKENYSDDCFELYENCLKLQEKFFTYKSNPNVNFKLKQHATKARVDIINKNNVNNTIEFIDVQNGVNIDFPDWFKKDDGVGAFIETEENSFDLKLKCTNDGLLIIYLRGPVIQDGFGKLIPNYVDYNVFRINNKDIIQDKLTVWHNEPYTFEKYVFDGEIVELHFEWI